MVVAYVISRIITLQVHSVNQLCMNYKQFRLNLPINCTGTRTVGIISKINQVTGESKSLAAVQARAHQSADVPWVALIGQPVSIASAQSGWC